MYRLCMVTSVRATWIGHGESKEIKDAKMSSTEMYLSSVKCQKIAQEQNETIYNISCYLYHH